MRNLDDVGNLLLELSLGLSIENLSDEQHNILETKIGTEWMEILGYGKDWKYIITPEEKEIRKIFGENNRIGGFNLNRKWKASSGIEYKVSFCSICKCYSISCPQDNCSGTSCNGGGCNMCIEDTTEFNDNNLDENFLSVK